MRLYARGNSEIHDVGQMYQNADPLVVFRQANGTWVDIRPWSEGRRRVTSNPPPRLYRTIWTIEGLYLGCEVPYDRRLYRRIESTTDLPCSLNRKLVPELTIWAKFFLNVELPFEPLLVVAYYLKVTVHETIVKRILLLIMLMGASTWRPQLVCDLWPVCRAYLCRGIWFPWNHWRYTSSRDAPSMGILMQKGRWYRMEKTFCSFRRQQCPAAQVARCVSDLRLQRAGHEAYLRLPAPSREPGGGGGGGLPHGQRELVVALVGSHRKRGQGPYRFGPFCAVGAGYVWLGRPAAFKTWWRGPRLIQEQLVPRQPWCRQCRISITPQTTIEGGKGSLQTEVLNNCGELSIVLGSNEVGARKQAAGERRCGRRRRNSL